MMTLKLDSTCLILVISNRTALNYSAKGVLIYIVKLFPNRAICNVTTYCIIFSVLVTATFQLFTAESRPGISAV